MIFAIIVINILTFIDTIFKGENMIIGQKANDPIISIAEIPKSAKSIFNTWQSNHITQIWNEIQEETKKDFPETIPFNAGTDNRYSNILCVKSTAIPASNFDETDPSFRYLHANKLDVSSYGVDLEIIASQAPFINPEISRFKQDREIYNFWSKISELGYSILNLTKKDEVIPYASSVVGEKKAIRGEDTRIHVSATTPVHVLSNVKPEDAILDQWQNQVQTQVKIQEFDVVESSFTCDPKKGHVTMLHYTDWPDLGVISLNELKRLIEIVEAKGGNKILVHCKAGVGRTGTLVTALFLKNFIKNTIITEENYDIEFKKLIVSLRKQRCAEFVQTPEQCNLVYELGISYLKDSKNSSLKIKDELESDSKPRIPNSTCFSIPEIAPMQLIASDFPTYDSVHWTAFANHKSTIVDITSSTETNCYAPTGSDVNVFNATDATKRVLIKENKSELLGQSSDYPSLESLKILNYKVERNKEETDVKRFSFNNWTNKVQLPQLLSLVKYVEDNGGENIWVHDGASNTAKDDKANVFITAFVLSKLISQNKINESNFDNELMNLIVQLKAQKGTFLPRDQYQLIHDFGIARLRS